MDSKAVIECQNLVKTFDNHTVINNLNFKIYKNKITTILGFSGAGKSTLMKLILGLETPTNGKVIVLDKDLATLNRFEMREFRRNFGMVFQYAALFDSMSAVQNVAFPLKEFSTFSQKEIEQKAQELLISVGIEPISFDKLPSELSGGMRKRVGLARALALNPHIMLYDEPTTGLDPITTKMVNNLIVSTAARHKDRGMTSVIISHDVKASIQISDYIAFLDRGRIIEYLPTEQFVKSANPLVHEFLNL